MQPFDQLTRAGQTRRLRQLARHALAHYDLDEAALTLLAPEVNTTFRLDLADGRRYVLRVYLPGDRSLRQIRSEIAWMAAVSRDTDLLIPEPMLSRDGEILVTAEAPGVPEPRHCAVFSYLPGRSISRAPSVNVARLMGAALAHLHNQADTFTPPPDFMDDKLDQVWPFGRPAGIYADEPNDLFSAERQAMLRETADRIQATLDNLYADAESLRFIHADLHHGNVKLHRGVLQVLDFGDCCWGYPVQDIAISLYYMRYNPAIRPALQRGYTQYRPWPETQPGLIDTLIVARHLDLISWVCAQNDPHYDQWLAGMLDRFTEELRTWLDSGD